MRGVGHRHERAVRCDGRGWRDRRTRRMRTAKSCGSGAAVLALRPREATLLRDNGGKRAVLREEHEVSHKAIAQGRPECSRCPVCSCAVLFSANRTRDRGCSKHPVFPAPSVFRGGQTKMQTSGAMRREIAKLYQRHCERSEAIHPSACRAMDCFAALAMTGRERCPIRLPGHRSGSAASLQKLEV